VRWSEPAQTKPSGHRMPATRMSLHAPVFFFFESPDMKVTSRLAVYRGWLSRVNSLHHNVKGGSTIGGMMDTVRHLTSIDLSMECTA